MAARSRLYLRQNDAEAALADVGRVIEFAPEVAIFYAYRGAAKAIGGDMAGARDDFDRARSMATDPGDISFIDEQKREVGL